MLSSEHPSTLLLFLQPVLVLQGLAGVGRAVGQVERTNLLLQIYPVLLEGGTLFSMLLGSLLQLLLCSLELGLQHVGGLLQRERFSECRKAST